MLKIVAATSIQKIQDAIENKKIGMKTSNNTQFQYHKPEPGY